MCHTTTYIGCFCCDPQHFTVLGVDPSFNVGKFCYTLTTYRHLMVVDKVTGKNPVMIGPVLFHMRKLESSYKLLASTMVNLNPNLSGLLSFGTDGELNIGKAFSFFFFLLQDTKQVTLQVTLHYITIRTYMLTYLLTTKNLHYLTTSLTLHLQYNSYITLLTVQYLN